MLYAMKNLEIERRYQKEGYILLAGLDDSGNSALVGPVVCAIVILMLNYYNPYIRDSKKIRNPQELKYLADEIKANCIAYAYGLASVEEINLLGIAEAIRLSMQRAIEKLSITPDLILIDGNKKVNGKDNEITIVNGDNLVFSISCASILAKQHRDELMEKLSYQYRNYFFCFNKGYPTTQHKEMILKYGITPHHRRAFKPVANYIHNAQRQGIIC